jgi:DDE superfamily endonuclease
VTILSRIRLSASKSKATARSWNKAPWGSDNDLMSTSMLRAYSDCLFSSLKRCDLGVATTRRCSDSLTLYSSRSGGHWNLLLFQSHAQFNGKPLRARGFVICADEKTSIRARCRCHPTLPPGTARLMCVEHEYDRGGALAYLAAYDVHRAQVFERCEDTTAIIPFGRLVEQVMTIEPYVSAKRVFWIVDNRSSHRGQASIKRLQGQWPTLRLLHLPVHASWLDQCEIIFSIIQRKVVTPNDFTGLDEIRELLAAFEHRYNAIAEHSTGNSVATT